jgi:hypothetical protein
MSFKSWYAITYPSMKFSTWVQNFLPGVSEKPTNAKFWRFVAPRLGSFRKVL